jgi:CxxC motif-containing protein (DUF1111 family)
MRRLAERGRGALLLLAGCTSSDPLDGLTIVGDDPSDLAIEGVGDEWLARFDAGDASFELAYRESQGLGPLYIRQSCASCHEDDGRGPGAVQKMVMIDGDGAPSPDQSALPYGHTVRPQRAGAATQSILAPERDDVLVTLRFGPPVFGRGYIDAVLDSEIERVAAEQAARGDAITGRVHRVPWQADTDADPRFYSYTRGSTALIGRFGLKARIATVEEFVADALQGDMGITSPQRAIELPNPDGLADDAWPGVDVGAEVANEIADYVRLLRIPTREGPPAPASFEALCGSCHVPSLRTRDDYAIAALAGIDAPIYSDLLIHDMGAELADGLSEHDASAREWRTAPLIGLRHLRSYLHDGRARTIEEAILLHRGDGSEANAAVDAFERIDPTERADLLEFVSAL